MPQSSRMMVTLRASASQRAMSVEPGALWARSGSSAASVTNDSNKPAVLTTSRPTFDISSSAGSDCTARASVDADARGAREYFDPSEWACGAAGSALPWHGRGRRFDPDQVHQIHQQLSGYPPNRLPAIARKWQNLSARRHYGLLLSSFRSVLLLLRDE